MKWFENGFKGAPKTVKIMLLVFVVFLFCALVQAFFNAADAQQLHRWDMCGNWEDSDQKGEVIEFECRADGSVLVKVLPLTFDPDRVPHVERESWVCQPFDAVYPDRVWQVTCFEAVPTESFADTGIPDSEGRKAIFSDVTSVGQAEIFSASICPSPPAGRCLRPRELLFSLGGVGIWRLDTEL